VTELRQVLGLVLHREPSPRYELAS